MRHERPHSAHPHPRRSHLHELEGSRARVQARLGSLAIEAEEGEDALVIDPGGASDVELLQQVAVLA